LPVWKVNLETDFEAFWRQTGHLSSIKRTRRRTRQFTFSVDAPGSAEWIIRQWAEKFREQTNQPADAVDDCILRAAYLQPRGRLHTFLLLDNGEPIAGEIGIVHRRELLPATPYRHPSYHRYGIGSRLLDLVCSWAAAQGFTRVDLGPTNAYKEKWAPVESERWVFRVSPPHLEDARWAGRLGRSLLVSLQERAKGIVQYAQRCGAALPG
jgi:CelD/BcsL family acetyltransferase involved in cellulose biosynthesis